jgi:hypothetical protein
VRKSQSRQAKCLAFARCARSRRAIKRAAFGSPKAILDEIHTIGRIFQRFAVRMRDDRPSSPLTNEGAGTFT